MKDYYGRYLTKNEIPEEINLDQFVKINGMNAINHNLIICSRCGTKHRKADVQLAIGSFYCPTCLNLGRVRSDEFLYHAIQQPFANRQLMNWSGHLTSDQQVVSDALVKATNKEGQTLVHAVTGAGKTEMIYASIDQALSQGKSVIIASPRIDVCIELHQRLERDFDCAIPLLHGKGKPYFRSPLVIATCHQLLRFKEAFDLVIIDEVDAFPFVDNDQLYHAVKQAAKQGAATVFLTATSTPKLEKAVKRGELTQLALPKRFHQNPLVVPKCYFESHFKAHFLKQRKTGFPLLIFFPEISSGIAFTNELQKRYMNEKIAFVASTSKNRYEYVEAFRKREISILVSTSILERGVTFPFVDVFLMHTHHKNFSASAIIQMAGRVGRHPDRPTGLVELFHQGKTEAMKKAIKEINKMNQLGGFK